MSGTSARRLSSAGLRTSNVGTPRWGGGPINSARGDPRLGKFKLRLLVTRHSMSLRAVPRWQAGRGAAGRSERQERGSFQRRRDRDAYAPASPASTSSADTFPDAGAPMRWRRPIIASAHKDNDTTSTEEHQTELQS